jgi:hypothetical protein
VNLLLSIGVYSFIMTTEDTATSKSSQEDKAERSGEENTTKPYDEKKVVLTDNS